MKRNLILMTALIGLMLLGSCSKDEPAPELSADKTDIEAAYTAASYEIAVTGNVEWAATVNSDAANWCTLSPASGKGNGKITLTVTENPLLVPRTATVTITAGALKTEVTVIQEECPTPVNAASTQTWTFGSQIWSDFINCPDCNDETYEGSFTEPECRSYTEGGKTFYYYNWAYVNANKETMCPAPWRMPAREDFETLANNVNADDLVNAWGFSGLIAELPSVDGTDQVAFYWSSTEAHPAAFTFAYMADDIAMDFIDKRAGMTVRCVRDK